MGAVGLRTLDLLFAESDRESLEHILDDFGVLAHYVISSDAHIHWQRLAKSSKTAPSTQDPPGNTASANPDAQEPPSDTGPADVHLGQSVVRVLLDSGKVEPLLDALRSRFGQDTWRAVIQGVEATVPQPEDDGPEETMAPKVGRLSRDELIADVKDALEINRIYIAMAVLSTVVAAVGLMRNNVAVIIGAMVIAPLLGPNMGLALATTLGDIRMARRALQSLGVGMGLAFLMAMIFGMLLPVDPSVPELANRTEVAPGDLVLAVVSGVAGALSFTTALSGTLIGVMVAVALMPPLVAAGLLFGSGNFAAGYGALLLLAANVVSVNLAGIGTFLVQGLLPFPWWKQRATRKAAYRVLGFWVVLLLALLALLWWRGGPAWRWLS